MAILRLVCLFLTLELGKTRNESASTSKAGTLYERMYFIEWTKNPKEQTSGLKEYDSSGPQRTAPSESQ